MKRYSAGKTNGRRLLVRRALAFAVLVAIAVGLVVSPYAVKPREVEAADSFNCGATITASVTLTHDVVCPAGDAGQFVLTIGANDIVVDGAGFTFDYSAATNVSRGIYGNNFSNLTIKNLTIVGGPETFATVDFTPGPLLNDTASLLNNTIPEGRIVMSGIKVATVVGNTATSSPGHALSIEKVPASSTYVITDNDLSNAANTSLYFASGDDPGVTLTLTGNTFDGSLHGARLNNILGPFTLSPAENNTFVGAGHTAGTPLQISGKDVTVDGWTTLGLVGGTVGIHVVQRTLNPFNTHRPSETVTISNNTITGPRWGVLTDISQMESSAFINTPS